MGQIGARIPIRIKSNVELGDVFKFLCSSKDI